MEAKLCYLSMWLSMWYIFAYTQHLLLNRVMFVIRSVYSLFVTSMPYMYVVCSDLL